MPIREFKCPKGHITERILNGEEDAKTKVVLCAHTISATRRIKCEEPAKRVDLSQTAPPVLLAGCGGFYKPTRREPNAG